MRDRPGFVSSLQRTNGQARRPTGSRSPDFVCARPLGTRGALHKINTCHSPLVNPGTGLSPNGIFFYSLRKSTQSWNVFRPKGLGSKRRLPWPPWLCRPRPCGHFGYRVCQPWPPTRSSPSMCTRRKAYNVAAKR